MIDNEWDFETLAIRTGHVRTNEGEHSEAIFPTSSFVFRSAAEAAARFGGSEPGNIYARFTNPTVRYFEDRLAALEGGEACVATSTGMSAILAVMLGLLKAGDHVVCSRAVFGTTTLLLQNIVGKFGVAFSFVDLTDMAGWEAALQPNTRLLFVETPANPLTEIVDIRELADLAHRNGSLLVVDNCFCTPALQRPLELGADYVVHSATKYLGGHGDLIAGAIVGDAETLTQVRFYGIKDMTGAVMSSQDAFLVLRGLKTLALRMDRHCQNAQAIATFLANHPAVAVCHYPGLESFPQYALAQRQMAQPGGMIAFELKGGFEAGCRFMNALKLITRAVSLGDAESLAQHPASMTHSTYTPEERAEHMISEGLVRISAGLEDIADLLRDVEQALCH